MGLLSRREVKAIRNIRYSAPSVEFENETGLVGISTPWIMPDGHTYESAQAYILPLFHTTIRAYPDPDDLFPLVTRPRAVEKAKAYLAEAEISKFFDDLAALNPDFNPLMRPLRSTKAEAVLGAISQFNIDDISVSAS